MQEHQPIPTTLTRTRQPAVESGLHGIVRGNPDSHRSTGLDDMGARGPDPDRHPEYGPSQRGERCLTPSTPSQCW